MKNANRSTPLHQLFAFLFIILTFTLLSVGYFHSISAITQDLGRHIFLGDIIRLNGSIPKTNLFSYTYPDFPFINHHYLPEIIFSLLYHQFSFQGLMILTFFLIFTSFGLLYFSALKKYSLIATSIVSLLLLRVLFERTDIRPELFSYLFLSLFLVILFKFREKYTRLIFLLPFIELLWVNSHIYFFIGLGVIGIFWLDELMRKRTIHDKNVLTLTLILGISSVITLINPNGIHGAIYPFTVFHNYGYSIEENQTPFLLSQLGFQKTSWLYLQISLGLLFTSLLLAVKKTRIIDWLLCISFSVIALLAVRNFPLFSLAVFLPFIRTLTIIISEIQTRVDEAYPKRTLLLFLMTAVLLCFVYILQIREVSSLRQLSPSPETGASMGIDFFQREKLKGPIFNNFDIGSYLIFRLYPQEKVFIDGRPEAYPAHFFKEVYIPMQQDPSVFQRIERKYGFNTILFSHNDMTPWAQQFIKDIIENENWKTVYLDPYMIILVKNTPKNAHVIAEYQKTKGSFTMSNLHDNSRNALVRALNFYQFTQMLEYQEPLLQKLLNLDPQDCLALQQLAQRSSTVPHLNTYLIRYQQHCL